MATPVVTVASGGLAVVDVTVSTPKLGLPVTEALNGRGMAVTKVAARGVPVTYSTVADYPAGGGGAFTPANLTGLIGWWDANIFSSLTIVSSDVRQIRDQSGNNNHLGDGTSITSVSYDATGFNGRPTLFFPAGNQPSIWNTAFPLGTGNTLTVFVVATMLDTFSKGSARLISYTAAGATHDWDNAGSFTVGREGSTASINFFRNTSGIVGAAFAYNTPHRVICTMASSGAMTMYIDGVAVATGTSSGNWVSPGYLSLNGAKFDASALSGYMDGPIPEAGIATGWHNATTVALLDTYLKNKWSL